MNNNNKETRLSGTEINRVEQIPGHARNARARDRLRPIPAGIRLTVPERLSGSLRGLSPSLVPSSLGSCGNVLSGPCPKPAQTYRPEDSCDHQHAPRSRRSSLRQAA